MTTKIPQTMASAMIARLDDGRYGITVSTGEDHEDLSVAVVDNFFVAQYTIDLWLHTGRKTEVEWQEYKQ